MYEHELGGTNMFKENDIIQANCDYWEDSYNDANSLYFARMQGLEIRPKGKSKNLCQVLTSHLVYFYKVLEVKGEYVRLVKLAKNKLYESDEHYFDSPYTVTPSEGHDGANFKKKIKIDEEGKPYVQIETYYSRGYLWDGTEQEEYNLH